MSGTHNSSLFSKSTPSTKRISALIKINAGWDYAFLASDLSQRMMSACSEEQKTENASCSPSGPTCEGSRPQAIAATADDRRQAIRRTEAAGLHYEPGTHPSEPSVTLRPPPPLDPVLEDIVL